MSIRCSLGSDDHYKVNKTECCLTMFEEVQRDDGEEKAAPLEEPESY